MAKDPILEESKFCEKCEPEVLQLVGYVRKLEDAQIVAKEALDTLAWANEKLTEKFKELEEKADGMEKANIKAKMQELHNAESRMLNRSKLGVQ